MAVSSKEIETLWKRYSDEGSKKGISVAEFFECTIVGSSPPETKQQASMEGTANEIPKSPAVSYVCINLSNGVKIVIRLT